MANARSNAKQPTTRKLTTARPAVEQLELRDLPSVLTNLAVADNLRGFTGYTPDQLLEAYGFSQLNISKPGQGETIAIVDAYETPEIQADLNTFDAEYNLPAVNLTVVNDGATREDPTGGWELETALDVEWAHAIAPYANIVLVEAANDFVNSAGVPPALLHAVSVASSQPGVNVVSMSWGVPEFATETQYDSYFDTPGVTYVAASGDSGEPPSWPAVSPNVVGVGGTTLEISSSGTYVSETGWGDGFASQFSGGSGGGISQYEPEPAYQKGGFISSVTAAENPNDMRMSPDVAYDANPSTGVAVYDSVNGGWQVVGGTSAGTPQWAATVTLADQLRAAANPAEPSLSSAQTLTALYQEQGDFHDLTVGNNGSLAGVGYDLVTGLGSPEANLLVPALAKQAAAPAPTPTPTPTPTPAPSPPSPTGQFVVLGAQIQATSGLPFSGVVATILDNDPSATPSGFTATIDWGDGTTSSGTITVDPQGGFDVSGTHTYTASSYSGWGWGGSGNGSGFGWGNGQPVTPGTQVFRITITVESTSTQQYALGRSRAFVTPATANQLFVAQVYQNLLGRSADAAGLAYWSNLLDQGASRQAVVLQIEQSQEYVTDEVEAVYQKMLHRQADPTGLAAFTNFLANGGTLEQVEATIAGSAEYFQTRGGGQVSGFLNALYEDALNRGVDPAGEAAFEQDLSLGVSRAAIAAAVFGSDEYVRDMVES
jgi:Domain of unknown function (DUF4214)